MAIDPSPCLIGPCRSWTANWSVPGQWGWVGLGLGEGFLKALSSSPPRPSGTLLHLQVSSLCPPPQKEFLGYPQASHQSLHFRFVNQGSASPGLILEVALALSPET